MRSFFAATTFLVLAMICGSAAHAQDAGPEVIALEPGVMVSGNEVAFDQLPVRYSIALTANDDLRIEIQNPESANNSGLHMQVLGPDGAGLLAEYHIAPTQEAQVRSMNVLAAGNYEIQISAAAESEESISYAIRASTTELAARGHYDGIWEIGTEGYAYITQEGELLTVLILGSGPTLGYRWEAQEGTLEGTTAVTDTIMGYVQLRLRFEFVSLTEGAVTLLRCNVLDVDYPCLFPQGTNIPLRKTDRF